MATPSLSQAPDVCFPSFGPVTSGLAHPRSRLGFPGAPFSTQEHPPERVATGRLRAGPSAAHDEELGGRPAKAEWEPLLLLRDRVARAVHIWPSGPGRPARPVCTGVDHAFPHCTQDQSWLAVHTVPGACALVSSAQGSQGRSPEPITPGRSLQRGPRPHAGREASCGTRRPLSGSSLAVPT